MNSLTQAKQVGGGDTSPSSADIQGFRQFNKLGASGVRSAEEYWYLNSEARRGAYLSAFCPAPFVHLLKTNIHCHSTCELVQG